MAQTFSQRLIAWQKEHGRHHLPWQRQSDPYRIWLSEIMLQQTQVTTVIPYYHRFLERFPTIVSLAAAPVDEVLKLWAGLGYYTRARNLHRAAQMMMEHHDGQFPQDFSAMVELPGVGRSTAGAISVFAFGNAHAILDGNVRRVLARCFAVAGYPGKPEVAKALWALSESLLPPNDLVAYTQGLMDLGSQVCTLSRPRCDECPLRDLPCLARQQSAVTHYPAARPARPRPVLEMQLLMIECNGKWLLEQRPERGIWAGLWTLPHLPMGLNAAELAEEVWGLNLVEVNRQPLLAHALTHRQMVFAPVRLKAQLEAETLSPFRWIAEHELMHYPLPAVIQKLLMPS